MSLKFSVVMISIDRSVDGKENYLAETLKNFQRAGGFHSSLLDEFQILVGSELLDYTDRAWRASHVRSVAFAGSFAVPASRRLLPCENAGHALISGGLSALRSSSDYVLFLEDDLDFCANFLESCSLWLSIFDESRYRLFSFGCTYPQVRQLFERQSANPVSWQYPVSAFYGTQCFAIRPSDALSLGVYLQSNPIVRGVNSPGAYDLMIHDWMKLTYPDPSYSHFLASVPSFVQHIGRQSICTGLEKTHTFPSWPGREWSFAK